MIYLALGILVLLLAFLSGKGLLIWYRFWDDLGK